MQSKLDRRTTDQFNMVARLGTLHVLVCLPLSLPFHSSLATATAPRLSLGVDFGTSGVRSCLVDNSAKIIHETSFSWQAVGEGNDAEGWRLAMLKVMEGVPRESRGDVQSICCSGTSSSALLFDIKTLRVSRQPRMYNFNVLQDSPVPENGKAILAKIAAVCPRGSATNAATSTLAKLLTWHAETPVSRSERLLHQSDYCSAVLTGAVLIGRGLGSDWNNALKLGYDVHELEYPAWLLSLLDDCGVSREVIPPVQEPGTAMGLLGASFCTPQWGYSPTCRVVAGTTDSIAAFLASGADEPGQAVTSLGSTLAVKLLSRVPVSDDSRGIYSHRLGGQGWLVGGASNVGCAVFRQLAFSDEELRELSASIDPASPAPQGYYPLPKPGERFPVNDPHKQPVLTPAPPQVTRREFLHGLLAAMADVEQQGYAALAALGADPVREVLTAGGGSRNDVWTEMRRLRLGGTVAVRRADNADAAFGAARLALRMHAQETRALNRE